MKLRNKLVAVMAASMVVTSVPVVTMADASTSISIYNYKIKDTTVGFKANNRTSANGMEIEQTVTSGTQFNANSVPTFEIEPSSNFNLGGDRENPAQSAYLSITKDSEFKEEALVYYIDALAGADQTTELKFVDGKAEGANLTALNGLTMSQILDLFEVNGKTVFTIYYTSSGTPYVDIAFTVDGDGKATELEYNTLALGDAGINITVMDLTETEISERKYKSSIEMSFFGKFTKGESYNVPFLVKVGGDKEVLAYLDGRDSFLEKTKTFSLTGVLSDKKLVATSDSKTITIDNIEEIGEIRLDENQIGALQEADNRWIKLKLSSSSDLEFNEAKTKKNIAVTGKRGFFGDTMTISADDVCYGEKSRSSRYYDDDDNRVYYEADTQVLLIQLPSNYDATACGQLVITGIYVQPQEKTAAVGDVNITLSEDLTHGLEVRNGSTKSTNLVESTTLKVATVTDYDVTIESDPVNVKAGRSGIVSETKATFTLKEAVKDSLVDTRKIEFELENGYIFGPADVNYNADYSTASYKQAAKAKFKELIADETIKFEEKAGKDGADEGFVQDSLDLIIDGNGYVTGFSGLYDRLKDTNDDKIKVTLPVAAPVMAKGEIKVKAGNLFTRSYEEDVEAVIAKIVEPIAVEVESAKLKVGLQDQTAGKVVIKETDKGMIERGWLYLSTEDFEHLGITFDKVPDIKVTSGNMEVKNVQISKDNKVVALEVTKTSTEASAIEISNIKFTADRTVPEANYDLEIWGDALTDENVLDVAKYSTNAGRISSARGQYTDLYVVPEFVVMTTKNTQDIDASGLKAATASFVIGQNSFVVNGETVAMDSAAYIKDNYTMVPVKYVAKAFGIEGNAIQYDQATSTATIVAGNKVISITAGKAYIVVNGTNVPMATKAEVVDGRMCVPMAYIASALDVQKSWDATTKTATFTNQADAQ